MRVVILPLSLVAWMMMMVGQTQDADVMFVSKGKIGSSDHPQGYGQSGGIFVGAVGEVVLGQEVG